MKLNLVLFSAFAAFILASCTKPDPTACECHSGIKKDGKEYVHFNRCEELRATDEAFQAAFKECAKADVAMGNTRVMKADEDLTKKKPEGEFIAQTEGSRIDWKGEKVTGKNHFGTLNIKSGSVSFTDGVLSAGNIVIDMASIEVKDLENEKPKIKLQNHLNSADFFDTANHPEARFEMTRAEAGAQNDYTIYGNLTIKGITKEATCYLIFVNKENGGLVAGGTMTFDRSQFDVRYGSGSFFDDLGDDLIRDEIPLKLQLTFSPAPNA